MFDLAGNAENYGGTLAAHRLQRIRALGAGAVAHPAFRAGTRETRILGRCVMCCAAMNTTLIDKRAFSNPFHKLFPIDPETALVETTIIKTSSNY